MIRLVALKALFYWLTAMPIAIFAVLVGKLLKYSLGWVMVIFWCLKIIATGRKTKPCSYVKKFLMDIKAGDL